MKPTKIITTYTGSRARLFVLPNGEAAVVAADIPTGRTPTFTYQILVNSAELKNLFTRILVDGFSRGRREGHVLTIAGVETFAKILGETKSRAKNLKATEEVIKFINEILLPEMRKLEGEASQVNVPELTNGVISVRLGGVIFEAPFQDATIDSVCVKAYGRSKTLTGSKLFEAFGIAPR